MDGNVAMHRYLEPGSFWSPSGSSLISLYRCANKIPKTRILLIFKLVYLATI